MNSTKILFIAVMATTVLASDASAQLFRGGLVRRVFGRDKDEESDKDEDKDKASDKKSASKKNAEAQRKKPSPRDERADGPAGMNSLKIFGMQLAKRQAGVVLISDLSKGGDAAAAGLQRGDRLVAIAGIQLENLEMLQELENSLESGDRVDIEFVRKGDTKTAELAFDHENVAEDLQPTLAPELELDTSISEELKPLALATSAGDGFQVEEVAPLEALEDISDQADSSETESYEVKELIQLLRQQQRVIESQSQEIMRLRALAGKSIDL